MENKTISNAKYLNDLIVTTTHAELNPTSKRDTKPQERKQQRQSENKYLIHEIVDSLMTS